MEGTVITSQLDYVHVLQSLIIWNQPTCLILSLSSTVDLPLVQHKSIGIVAMFEDEMILLACENSYSYVLPYSTKQWRGKTSTNLAKPT